MVFLFLNECLDVKLGLVFGLQYLPQEQITFPLCLAAKLRFLSVLSVGALDLDGAASHIDDVEPFHGFSHIFAGR